MATSALMPVEKSNTFQRTRFDGSCSSGYGNLTFNGTTAFSTYVAVPCKFMIKIRYIDVFLAKREAGHLSHHLHYPVRQRRLREGERRCSDLSESKHREY